MNAYLELPAILPKPVDDGACAHLTGMAMPNLSLPSTSGHSVDIATFSAPRTILYCYPRSGEPGKPLPEGWDDIPGARGCTPQACTFRDHHRELQGHNAEIFALSTQTSLYQKEFATRLHLPFDILSDEKHRFCDALRLPTFIANNERLIKRLTLIIHNKKIEKVFYPVFPPDQHAMEVVHWLEGHPL